MIRIRKILFPTDFSESADRALTHAVYLAQKYGAELHMLHVIVLHEDDPYNPAHHFPDKEEILGRLQEAVRDQMSASMQRRELAELDVHRVERRNVSAGPAIAEYAEEADIDLIVMGTHGRRGFRHLLAGSVAEEVIRTAPCAVLAVRGSAEPKPLAEIQRVLAPIDFSDASKEALVVARHVARNYDADLELLHVLENVLHPAFYNMGAQSIKDLQPDIEERTEAALHRLYEESAGPQVRATYHAVEGHAAGTIVNFTKEEDVDIIVIATHGMSALEQFVLGSTAEKVVRRAACPVLVVKSFARSLVVPDGA